MTQRIDHDAGEAWSAVACETVIDLVREACERDPAQPALVFEDGLVVTRQAFLERIESFAAYLAERIEPGDRVAVALGSRTEFMVAWVSVIANRGTLVSLNPAAGPYDARHVLRDSGACIAIVDGDIADVIEGVHRDCPRLKEVIVVGHHEPDGLMKYGVPGNRWSLAESPAERTDIVNIFYTSGTTGPPKGCMVDHEWWLRAVDLDLRLDPKRATDRLLCCLQFFYNDASLLLLAALHSRGTLVVMRKFSVTRFWNVIREHRVTRFLGIGSMPALLLKGSPTPHDRDHEVVRAIQVAIPPALHHELNERWGFPWLENYGITEGGIVARMPLSAADEMVGSGAMGIPCPEVELRLVKASGDEVATGEVGEIVVRAPGMMRGYLNRPDSTREVMRDGWLYTGDLAYADKRGFLYFAGREKDIIRRSGQNVAATEVEDVLRLHPKIAEAAVIAVEDELRGEELKAFVVPADTLSDSSLTAEEVVDHCAALLAPFKVPRFIEFREAGLPLTPTMRVRKEMLRVEEAARPASERAWDREQDYSPERRAKAPSDQRSAQEE